MKSISSRQNVWFKRVKDALREHREEIVLEGDKQVADAIRAGWDPIAVIAKGGNSPASADLAFTPELFDALAETKSPQNLIGLFKRPEGRGEGRGEFFVALDGVQDPGNVGTIVRLAAAFDCAAVALLPGCADPYSPKAIRASAGAILAVPVFHATAGDLLAPVYFADRSGDPAAAPVRGTIVFGSEGSGVSDAIRRRGTAIAIPMTDRVESLNVAAAAAILLSKSYEARGARPSRPHSPGVSPGDR